MAMVNRPDGSANPRTLFSLYSDYLWNRVRSLFSYLPSPNFLGKIPIIYRQAIQARSRRRRRPSFPLPLPSSSLENFVDTSESSSVTNVLEDVLQHIFLDLHIIQKNLLFWHSRAEGSNARKTYFLIFERGPKAFFDGTVRLMRECIFEGRGLKNTCNSASGHIYERITVLTSLRYHLATFLAQIYVEIDRFGEELVKDPEKALPKLLVTIHGLFSNLEESITHFHTTHQGVSSVDNNCSVPEFDKLPTVNLEGSQWTDNEIRDATKLIYENLQKLDSYLTIMVAKNRKPRKLALHWMRYTFGIVGVSVCSFWLLKHSRVMGSSDINNWIREAKDSTRSFWNDHVEQPLFAIRDELFETFRKRHRSVMELEEVQLTSKSLHRMLLAFSEQTKGKKVQDDSSDQEMLEIVMARYEDELMHPIKNLLGGELARALLIQIQKLKLDIETAMLELNQILRANEINFAVLAALPAFFVSLGLIMGVRAWLKQDTRAEGRGRVARLQRRLLIVEVERGIMQFQTCLEQERVKDAECMFGLVLYNLDRLYRAVERHAQATGEWQCLREDLRDLAKPGFQTAYKLTITSRMERLYDCLLPSSKRQ